MFWFFFFHFPTFKGEILNQCWQLESPWKSLGSSSSEMIRRSRFSGSVKLQGVLRFVSDTFGIELCCLHDMGVSSNLGSPIPNCANLGNLLLGDSFPWFLCLLSHLSGRRSDCFCYRLFQACFLVNNLYEERDNSSFWNKGLAYLQNSYSIIQFL